MTGTLYIAYCSGIDKYVLLLIILLCAFQLLMLFVGTLTYFELRLFTLIIFYNDKILFVFNIDACISIQRVDRLKILRFTVTDALLAARGIRISRKNQHA